MRTLASKGTATTKDTPEKLIRSIKGKNVTQTALQQLNALKQHQHEPVAQFAIKMNHLLLRADPAMSEEMKLFFLWPRLRHDIAWRVRDQGPTSCHVAIQIAQQIKGTMHPDTTPLLPTPSSGVRVLQDVPAPMDIDVQNSQLHNRRNLPEEISKVVLGVSIAIPMDMFANFAGTVGHNSRFSMLKYRTGDATPIKMASKRRSPKEKLLINQAVQDMLAKGVIKPSYSDWALEPHLVKKDDGSYRFCIDFQPLNKVTMHDLYPLPRLDDLLDQLGKSRYFTSLDLDSRYWQIPLNPNDAHKTAFRTPTELYQFIRMPFGLSDAGSTFQRKANLNLSRTYSGRSGIQSTITAQSSQDFSVNGYTDSNYAGDLDKRRSASGYVFTLARGAISWQSRLQDCITQSTMEAEYVAANEACKEAIWLGRLVADLGIKVEMPDLYCNSQSAIQLAKNLVFHLKTKHIDVKYHFIREVLEDKQIRLMKIHTKDNPANLLTKGLPREGFVHCCELLGIG
ncbi:hypothetical protein L7F22_028219 [Adiantum nelumboides]|nr:hypothetical protein [Adiantum nelumboides]